MVSGKKEEICIKIDIKIKDIKSIIALQNEVQKISSMIYKIKGNQSDIIDYFPEYEENPDYVQLKKKLC